MFFFTDLINYDIINLQLKTVLEPLYKAYTQTLTSQVKPLLDKIVCAQALVHISFLARDGSEFFYGKL